MDWRIITVGKPGHAWVKTALELYWQRLKHHGRFEHIVIKEGSLAQVEAQMTTASEHSLRVVLDSRRRVLQRRKLRPQACLKARIWRSVANARRLLVQIRFLIRNYHRVTSINFFYSF